MTIQFNRLISALAGAVVEANRQVKQTHLGELSRYFNKEGTPICTTLKIPRGLPENKEHIDVNVPLISLVNPGQLTIQQMQITMQIDLNALLETENEKQPIVDNESRNSKFEWKATDYKSQLSASTESGNQPKHAGTSQVVLTITKDETPEGLSKLINHLNKSL